MTSLPRGKAARAPGQTVLGWVLPYVIAEVIRQGADAQPIQQLPGLRGRSLDDPDVRVPESVAQAVWATAARLTGDDALGLHVAASMPRGALDLVEYAFRSSSSLGVGLARLARYTRVLSDRVAARVESQGDDLVLFVGDTGTTPLHPARAEFSLAVALRLAREATAADVRPLQVTFAHEAPADVGVQERFFRGPIHYAAGSTSMVVGRSDADRALQGADPALSVIVRRRLEKVLAEREQPDNASLAWQVRRMVIDELGQVALTPGTVARRLGLSVRTLSRRLASEHTSFRQILDDARCQLATALLHDHTLSVADIAFFLQYSEPAAFHRSFRRWTGLTPRGFRQGDTAA